jgi:hypothetical protein
MDKIEEISMKEMYNNLATHIENFIIMFYKKKLGFCLLTFPFNSPNITNYVSNANREDMIKALRETADRLERGEDNKK